MNIALDTIARVLKSQLDANGMQFRREGKQEIGDSCSVFIQIQRGTLQNWIKAIEEAAQ